MLTSIRLMVGKIYSGLNCRRLPPSSPCDKLMSYGIKLKPWSRLFSIIFSLDDNIFHFRANHCQPMEPMRRRIRVFISPLAPKMTRQRSSTEMTQSVIRPFCFLLILYRYYNRLRFFSANFPKLWVINYCVNYSIRICWTDYTTSKMAHNCLEFYILTLSKDQ